MSRVVQRAVTQVRRSPCLSLGRWAGSTTRRCHWQWTVAAAPSSEILLLAARSRVRQPATFMYIIAASHPRAGSFTFAGLKVRYMVTNVSNTVTNFAMYVLHVIF